MSGRLGSEIAAVYDDKCKTGVHTLDDVVERV